MDITELRDFHCDDCGKDFSENKSLQRHIRAIHSNRNKPEKPVDDKPRESSKRPENPVNSGSEELFQEVNAKMMTTEDSSKLVSKTEQFSNSDGNLETVKISLPDSEMSSKPDNSENLSKLFPPLNTNFEESPETN